MKSDSVTVEAASIDALADALKNKYSECSEIPSQSKDLRLLVIEKYYFRTGSNALGVVLIESIGQGMYLVNLIAGGGREGMIGMDWGAENQFIGEMKKIVLSGGEVAKAGGGKADHDPLDATSERCTVCHQLVNKGDSLVKCPSCGGRAHKTHMLEWLHTRDHCPSCRVHLTESSLKPVK